MIKVKVDMVKLEASLKRAAKAVGETNAQAVARWGVSTCRELAKNTQAFGVAGTKKKQEVAISAGGNSVLVFVDRLGPKNKRALRTAEEVNQWIEAHRGSRGRTAKLPFAKRGACTPATFRKAMRIRYKLAGAAKGGWIGAGISIASHQTGQGRINIGKNYLGYAHKHSRLGSASPGMKGHHPIATLRNRAKHTASSWVLSKSAMDQSIAWGAKKAISWYRHAAKSALEKV